MVQLRKYLLQVIGIGFEVINPQLVLERVVVGVRPVARHRHGGNRLIDRDFLRLRSFDLFLFLLGQPFTDQSIEFLRISFTVAVGLDDALKKYSGTDSVLMTVAFNEADANNDNLLTGNEISEYDRLAKLGMKFGVAKYAEPHEEHGAITRYCTTHGRVATGEDFKCPYCIEDGIDPATVKDSTKYNQ